MSPVGDMQVVSSFGARFAGSASHCKTEPGSLAPTADCRLDSAQSQLRLRKISTSTAQMSTDSPTSPAKAHGLRAPGSPTFMP